MNHTRSQAHLWINIFLTILIPAFQILKGQSSLFYIIYIFWWAELIATTVELIDYYIRKTSKTQEQIQLVFSRYFLLFIYFVFIVVVFGLLPSFGNQEIMKLNVKTFFFKDMVFNSSILFIIINECWYRYSKVEENETVEQSPFSGRMMVMHLSIIFGGLIFTTAKYSNFQFAQHTFQWHSLLMAIPFLLLKTYMMFREYRKTLQ